MFITNRSLLHFCCLVFVGIACTPSVGQDSSLAKADAAINSLVDQLSSRRFAARQEAFDHLVSEGSRAVAAVEAAVARTDLDHADRCVEILAEIAREKESRDAALSALDRLAADKTRLGSALAKRRAFELRETNEERAVRLLTAAGVRIHRSSRNNSILSISGLYLDGQCAHLQHLTSLRSASFSGLGVTDRCFAHLVKVPQLQSVSILGCDVSNAGLADLSKLPRLDQVHLAVESLNADGFKHLGNISNLSSVGILTPIGISELKVLSEIPVRSLYLSDLEMSDGVAEILSRLERQIQSLHVTIKCATDEDLRWVNQTKVSSISLSIEDSPQVTDDGLLHLQATGLRSLRLRQTGVSAQCLTKIAGIPALSSLSVYDAPITDKELTNLTKLSQLRSLSLGNTKVSDQGLDLLKKSMPRLRYVRNHPRAAAVVPVPAPPAAR